MFLIAFATTALISSWGEITNVETDIQIEVLESTFNNVMSVACGGLRQKP